MKKGKTDSTTALITCEEILALMEDYRIGRKPLAKVLGWGDTTIMRYLKGEHPTPEYSDKLRRIAADPAYYYKILTSNADKITDIAYKKSLACLSAKMTCSRILAAAQYVINRSDGDISAKRVQAILYYSQAFSLALHARELFEEEFMVSRVFMPYPEVFNNMRQNGTRIIELPKNAISEDDKNVIDSIYNALDWYGPEPIRIITARERSSLYKSRTSTSQKYITKDALRRFFITISMKYNVTKPAEINSYFNQRLKEITNTRKE